MNRRLVASTALLLVALSGFCSACCFNLRKEKPVEEIQKFSKVPLRYNHEELFKKLGFSIQFPDLHLAYVGADLAATKDKDQPRVFANKYSVNDLLAPLKVYKSEFTVEGFKERRDLCESLSPHNAAQKPKNDYVRELIETNKYIEGYRADFHEDEDRTPQEFAVYKNLHDYCNWVFGKFLGIMREEFKLDDELDEKVMKLLHEVHEFYSANPKKYRVGFTRNILEPEMIPVILTDFTKTKEPNEVAEIKATCSELIERVAFLAEFEFGGKKSCPPRYTSMYRYCTTKPWKSE